jgi:hypothetical protein
MPSKQWFVLQTTHIKFQTRIDFYAVGRPFESRRKKIIREIVCFNSHLIFIFAADLHTVMADTLLK